MIGYFLNIDQNVIQIHYNKDVKLFSKDLSNVILKIGRSIGESKKHDLVLEMAISDTKGSLPFMTFSNPYLVIGISEVELGNVFGPT